MCVIIEQPLRRFLMGTNDNKLLVRRYIDEVINTGNVDEIEEFISPEYTEVYEGRRYALGIAGAKEHILGVRQTYPDLTLTVGQQIAEGEWVATVITARGTHQGIWLGIKPTGKVLTYSGVNLDRIIDGRIVEHGGAANMLAPLLDSGAVLVAG
jgi:predicted ester cyclase